MVKSQLLGKAKRGLAALVLSAGLVTGLENCVTTRTTNYTRFLTCNEWIDKNNNGVVDPFEYVGIKDQFRANEKITLVAEINSPVSKGAIFRTQILDSKGKDVSSFKENAILPFEYNVVRCVLAPWELYNLGGQGIYSAYFYLNNNLIGVKNFTLIR